jgi:hypothetical protein
MVLDLGQPIARRARRLALRPRAFLHTRHGELRSQGNPQRTGVLATLPSRHPIHVCDLEQQEAGEAPNEGFH